MALVFNGTVVIMDASKIPAGYVKPVVSTFFDPDYTTVNLSLTVAKSAVENLADAVTFDNILTDGAVGLNKQISDKLIAELDTVGNTIDAYAELRDVRSNLEFGDDLYTTVAALYRCSVRIFYKVA